MKTLTERLRGYLFLKMSHPQYANIADDCNAAADRIEELERQCDQNWRQGYIEAQHNAARGVDLDAMEAFKEKRDE